jgi:L-alanine-DL-glutamate epimerase-like enolase superfamily enzyme
VVPIKISKVEIIPFDQSYKGRLIFSSGSTPAVGAFILVRITTDEGFVGLGSTVGFNKPPRTKNGNTRGSAMALMKDLAPLLIGEDPLRTDYLFDKLEDAIGDWYCENWVVLSFFDSALYDLKGRILGVPVYDLLGGLYRERIPLEHIQSYLPTPEEQAKDALRYVEAGFKSIKLHVDANSEMSIKRMKVLRDALGPDIPIATDMSAEYRVSDALYTIERMNEYNLHFAEQPLHAYDTEGMKILRVKTSVPLVADQAARSITEAYERIRVNAFDGAHCLIYRIGGIRRSVKWANLMDMAHIDYQICNLGNTIAAAAGAHFAVTRPKRERFLDELGLYLYLHGTTDTASIKDDIVISPSGEIKDGYLYAPKGPGLGVEINEEILQRSIPSDICPITVK